MPQDKPDEEAGLPRATVDKQIQDYLKKNFTMSKEVKQSLKDSCQLFLSLIILEANRACETEKKKIITNQHIYKSLDKHGFHEYINLCRTAAHDYDDYSRHKPSKQDKFKESGKTLDELHQDQMRLFDQAKKEQNRAFGLQSEETEKCNEEQ